MSRPMRSASAAGYDRALDPMAPSDYVIAAIVDGLDHVAAAMERKWGVGRLRLLVGDDLRARFDAQKDKLDAAIGTGREPLIRIQAEGMKRAWAALDRAAMQAGEQPLSPLVWECVLPSTGEVVAIVRTEAEAHHVARECRVFSLDEVARLIDGLPEAVLATKQAFPGATITAVSERKPIDWTKGDEIPF